MNRFAQDTTRMDDELVKHVLPTVLYTILFLFVLISMSVYAPMMILPCVLVIIGVMYLIRYYLKMSREVERLQAHCLSPLFEHVLQTFSGVDVIRAFESSEKMFQNQMHRYFAIILLEMKIISSHLDLFL